MTPGRLVLVALVVVATIVFVAGLGIGLTRPQNEGSFPPAWAQSLGDALTTEASADDVVATSSACFSGSELTVRRGDTCHYNLATGFLARRLRLQADAVTATLPGTGILLTLTQPKTIPDQKVLGAKGAIVELRYHEQGAALDIRCVSAADCRVSVTGR